ncbi:branched-chain amino acid ABC transporter permease [Erwinia sp. CPCC 100877]|nr:branched-chain amino acid ABC transporter permease [Erwinia sp. CPCC 100877]
MKRDKNIAWREALHAVLPLCLSYIPVGLACGVLLQKVGFNVFLTAFISMIVFSGGAQFLVASMLSVNAPVLSTILMTFFLELRYALLSSSMSMFMKNEKRGFIALFSQSLNDENYAVNYLKYSTDPTWNKQKALYVNWFSLLSWLGSNVVGTMLGTVIHLNAETVHFALTSMFIFMFVMQMKDRVLIFTGILSGVLAVVFMLLFQNTFGLIVATVLASLCGYIGERVLKKQLVKNKKEVGELNTPLFPFAEKEAQKID